MKVDCEEVPKTLRLLEIVSWQQVIYYNRCSGRVTCSNPAFRYNDHGNECASIRHNLHTLVKSASRVH